MAIPLPPGHPDFPLLAPLIEIILEAAGGLAHFEQDIPQLLRRAIDEVIDSPRTGRLTLSDVEKTEKTYLGTKVEILLRAHLNLPKGRLLDLSLGGVETDIKNTIGGNWAIPTEAVSHPCVLVKENEKKAICSVGIIIAHEAYLNPGNNKDSKRGFSALSLQHAWWLLKDHPYPANFWEGMPLSQRDTIMNAGGGSLRVAALFRAVQNTPISRTIVQAVGQQDDYMKRIRRNGGARDVLAPEQIAILWGQKDRALIETLRLGAVGRNEFISYHPRTAEEADLLRKAKHID